MREEFCMPIWDKDESGRMVQKETADERAAREKVEKDVILQQLAPYAQRLADNLEDEEAYRAVVSQFSTVQGVQRLIDAEYIDGSGNAINFTFLPNGLVLKTYGSSGNFRIDSIFVLTEEKARESMDELYCIQTALLNSPPDGLHCSRCRQLIYPYQDCPNCRKTWKQWLEEMMVPIREERRKRELAEIVATGDTSKMYFDLSPDED